MFTSLLNKRLGEFATQNSTISENQTGFRAGYGTTDHVFLLSSIIDLYLSKKLKLYCTFIDYQKAFDTVWRAGLWVKLLRCGIRGKVFNVIHNMYQGIKSCVTVNGEDSEYFVSNIGVRQGENLSPFLFAVFVNDLEAHLLENNCTLLEFGDAQISECMKLLVLLYADDTVIMADTAHKMQLALDDLSKYCELWRLTINRAKSKVLIFASRRVKVGKFKFKIGDYELEQVDSFVYLGVPFSHNGRFEKCKKQRSEAGQRAMFSLLSKIRTLGLPISLQLELFDRMITPVLLYGCEAWGYSNNDILEKVHLRFCKYLLKCKTSTPTCLVYGELGRFPMDIICKVRMIGYWAKLVTGEEGKLSVKMYQVLYKLYQDGESASPWLSCIKRTLEECGMADVWLTQSFPNLTWLKKAVHLRLNDQFIQGWHAQLVNCEKCVLYRTYKEDFGLEKYLSVLPMSLRMPLCKFRTSNHKLPIERGRYNNTLRHQRVCNLCELDKLGDEYHLLLECQTLRILRKKYIPLKFWKRPNTLIFWYTHVS
jgi:hypothetical protein